jgi:hypothetical protein
LKNHPFPIGSEFTRLGSSTLWFTSVISLIGAWSSDAA